MSEALALLPGYLGAHLRLTLVALALAIGLSVPLGIWVQRRPGLGAIALGTASVIQTVPSLALLAIMVPALAWLASVTGLELRSIGYPPAVIALTLYGVLPVLRNTVTGLAGVDPAVVEAARAVGMTPGQRLRHVELPLALPVLVAGIRTAAVWTVGMATLSTPVGATSLGNYIFSGLQTRNLASVLVGCVAAAALALVLDGLVRMLESGTRERRPARTRLAAAGLVSLALLTALSAWNPRAATLPLRIGTKTFTEQYVLGEILAGVGRERLGVDVELVTSLGSTVAFDALTGGEIDVYVDYSGTLWSTVMGREGLPPGRDEVLADVRDWLEQTHGIRLAAALGFENTYALAMREAHAAGLGVRSIADLVPLGTRLELAGDYEFFHRPEWTALREAYGLEFANRRSMDSALMYTAVARGEVDVITAFSTDGRIAALDLRVLEDTRAVIPPYDAIVLVGAGAVREHPGLLEAIGRLEGAIDAPAMRRMNLAVDDAGRSPAEVAAAFLAAQPSGSRR